MLATWKKSCDKPRRHIKKQRYHFADKASYSHSYGLSSNHIWLWELHHKEKWTPKNWCCWSVVLEKTLESPLDCKEIKPVNPKGNKTLNILWKDWLGSSNTLAIWWEGPSHWKRPWYWERLRAGVDGRDRGSDGWMASLTQWTWVWRNSRRWRRTVKPCILQFMGSQRVAHERATEQQYENMG